MNPSASGGFFIGRKDTEMKNYEAPSCDNCGAEMTCFGDLNCECADIIIPEHVNDFIAASYDRCLCRKCIFELIEKMGKEEK